MKIVEISIQIPSVVLPVANEGTIYRLYRTSSAKLINGDKFRFFCELFQRLYNIGPYLRV